MYELTLSEAGLLSLTLDGEVMWTSDADAEFCEEFGDMIETQQIENASAWLVEAGYIPPKVAVDFIDETNGPGDEDDEDEDEDIEDADSDDEDDPDEDDEP